MLHLLVFHAYFTGILMFKGLTVRHVYKSFDVKGLKIQKNDMCQNQEYEFVLRGYRIICDWLRDIN
jgi:hypothetical protein